MNKVIRLLILVTLMSSQVGFARTGFAVLPFADLSVDSLDAWYAHSVPDIIYRSLRKLDQAQVWDPVYLHLADPLSPKMLGDSVLLEHARRWNWLFAVGGLVQTEGDSVTLRLRIAGIDGEQIRKKEIVGTHSRKNHLEHCVDAVFSILDLAGTNCSAGDSAAVRGLVLQSLDAYPVYAAGFGYELNNCPSLAVSAYEYAVKMDNSFVPAHTRLAALYAKSGRLQSAAGHYRTAASVSRNSSVEIGQYAHFLVEYGAGGEAEPYLSSNSNSLQLSPEGMTAQGHHYLKSGEYERAIAAITRAVSMGPSDLRPYFLLGHAYSVAGNHNAAVDVLNSLINYRPGYLPYYAALGTAYRSAGRYMESRGVLDAALRVDPDDIGCLISLSSTYFYMGWYEKSEQLLLRALEVDPNLSSAYVNLAVVKWKKGDRDAAREMLEAPGIERQTGKAGLNNYANTLFLKGRKRKALKTYRKADRTGGKEEVIPYNIATVHLSRGKLRKAAGWYDEVLRLDPTRRDVLLIRADIAERTNSEEDAEIYYRMLLELDPLDSETMTKLIDVLMAQERFEEALQITENYLSEIPGDRQIRLMVPYLYQKMGWYEVAVSRYEELLKDDDFHSEYRIYLRLGESMYALFTEGKNKEYDQAIYYLKNAVEHAPENYKGYMLLGDMYSEFKGLPEEAVQYWETARSKAHKREIRRAIRSRIAEATP